MQAFEVAEVVLALEICEVREDKDLYWAVIEWRCVLAGLEGIGVGKVGWMTWRHIDAGPQGGRLRRVHYERVALKLSCATPQLSMLVRHMRK